MKRLSLIASALAVLGLTACEKGLVEDIADVSAMSQVTNSVLQVRTRSGGSAGGASSSDYVLPTTDDAAATSAIALCEGHSHGDLMTAQATATLTDGGTNTVTLGMTRKTMLIQSVAIKKVPTAATAVSVTIAPLWQALTVSGTFSGVSGSQTIALTKQEDNRRHLDFDQLMIERRTRFATVWVHVSYVRQPGRRRNRHASLLKTVATEG